MNKPKVYADFHNADAKGRLRLNCVGTIQDLTQQQIMLHETMSMTFYSEDVEADGQVFYSEDENIWVAVIDWDAIKRLKSEPDTQLNNEINQRRQA